jgi:hypothetical protein
MGWTLQPIIAREAKQPGNATNERDCFADDVTFENILI